MGSKKQQKKNNDNRVSVILIIGIILIGAVLSIALLANDSGCSGCEGDGKYVASPDDVYALSDFKNTDEVTNFVKITVKGHGSMIVELYPDVAPITVANFKQLVSESFYDGLTFHRIRKGFMIQGGAPNASSRSVNNIKGEFSLNGVENNLSHTRGVISMARASAYDSASSQFFICDTADYITSLDGKYAAFGKVVTGYTVLDSIASVPVEYGSSGELSSPTETVTITSISFAELK